MQRSSKLVDIDSEEMPASRNVSYNIMTVQPHSITQATHTVAGVSVRFSERDKVSDTHLITVGVEGGDEYGVKAEMDMDYVIP